MHKLCDLLLTILLRVGLIGVQQHKLFVEFLEPNDVDGGETIFEWKVENFLGLQLSDFQG